MLYHELPDYCTSIPSALPPPHGATYRGTWTECESQRQWTPCRGLSCDTWMGLLYLSIGSKILLIKQWKNKIVSAFPIAISMVFHHQPPLWSYGAQLSHYDYFKNNRHVQKGACIWLSALKFKNSCTDAISGWEWRQPCEWKPKMSTINQP